MSSMRRKNEMIGSRSLLQEIASIFEALGGQYNIDYAILFGSVAKSCMRSDSDVDIAIKLRDPPSDSKKFLRIFLNIKYALEEKLHRVVDIVILNGSSIGLQYEVFSTGRPVYISDSESLFRDKIMVIKMYLDFKYYLERHFKELVKWIDSGI